jgi:hypothetical protein
MLFRSFLWFLLFVFLAYALYRVIVLVMRKYNLNLFGTSDSFQGKQIASTPAPAVTTEVAPIQEPRGPVSPAGPNPPSAAPPPPQQPVVRLPEERANDTMDQVNSEVPIKDNLRHPERMFNAGGEHSGTKRGVESGIAGDTKGAPAGPAGKFSPDFAQNGGEFMNGIFANDMVKGDNFAEI